jgi:hypothetical protein
MTELQKLKRLGKSEAGRGILKFLIETRDDLEKREIDTQQGHDKIAIEYIAKQEAIKELDYVINILTPQEGD